MTRTAYPPLMGWRAVPAREPLGCKEDWVRSLGDVWAVIAQRSRNAFVQQAGLHLPKPRGKVMQAYAQRYARCHNVDNCQMQQA